MQTSVPRLAALHDLSCFGRAALTVVLPILSTMGIQVCPLPTELFSTHGAFPGYERIDLAEPLQAIIDHWRALAIRFDAIYSGFLGSTRQIDIAARFIRDFTQPAQLVVVDPVLGDNGKSYGVTAPGMVAKMRTYIRLAHVITPNLTEAALLLEEPYRPDISETEVKDWLARLAECGPEIVIITSVPVLQTPNRIAVLAYNRKDGRFWRVAGERIPGNFPGAGDAFTSVVTGSLLQGDPLPVALDRAVQFLALALRTTFAQSAPVREGILLEKVLPDLAAPLKASSYELF